MMPAKQIHLTELKVKYPLLSFLRPCNFHWLLFCLVITGCYDKATSPFSESAENALSTFKLPPGFKIELVAADPLISDPVDMTIDEEGRMYVVEMHGYPLGLELILAK